MEELKQIVSSEEDRRWCVYIHTNVHNGKKYVGITNNIEERWKNNGSKYLNKRNNGEYVHPAFANALLKYDNWKEDWLHEVVVDCLTKNEANKKEVELIALYKTNAKRYSSPFYGYNLTDGGDGGCAHLGHPHSDDTKQLLSKQSTEKWSDQSYRETTMKAMQDASYKLREYAKNRPPEVNQKIGDGRRAFLSIKENHPCYGKPLPESIKQKLIDAIIIPVVQITKTGEFVAKYKSRQEAENETGIDSTNICACCNGDRISAGGFLWINADTYDPTHTYTYDELKHAYENKHGTRKVLRGPDNPMYGTTISEEMKRKISEAKSISVVQLTKDGKYVSEYKSSVEANRMTGISAQHIGHCCNSTRISAGGYLWVHKDEYDVDYIYSYEERKQLYKQKLKEKEINI